MSRYQPLPRASEPKRVIDSPYLTAVANWLTFFLWTAIAAAALFALISCEIRAEFRSEPNQERTPLATEGEAAVAPLVISRDGKTITVRATAKDDLRFTFEPRTRQFGRTVTFTVGDVRSGRWGLK